jgi:hypothetical protein
MFGQIFRPLLELITAATILGATLTGGPGLLATISKLDAAHMVGVVAAAALIVDIVIMMIAKGLEALRPAHAKAADPARSSQVPPSRFGRPNGSCARAEDLALAIDLRRGRLFLRRTHWRAE